ncbi:hypothetical protein P171DRAFT_12430 [Karstenula rhodostoma CBS 690.94]|uniref:Arrestin-like N-terminal domain-containing protein n=1 Tax=Karstenula rhodostoma CBS 690.94 TaxID=1392251 RepID=A0A9P4UJL5_9PLEO|nr:hypothetical protein P171DRAFT_12430 [Karstenula rhodostoma CBS 690.94]
MGLFSSNKKPLPALPILALHLTNSQDKVFKPNDTIQGHVTLSTPTPILPQAIEVSLWGHSSVWLRTSSGTGNDTTYRHYRDNVPLFDVIFNLFTQPQQLQPGQSYSFPFQFRVPEGTSSHRIGGYKDDMDARWTVQPHHLPPTFAWGSRPDWPDNASVSYGVTARLICPGIGVGKHHQEPLSATSPILFQPLNPNLNAPYSVIRHPKPFTLASSSLAGRDPSSIGFRQKLADKFSSETPKLDFELGVELPDLLTSGSEFKFRSTFNVLSKAQNVVQIPAITFKVLKLDLLDFTFVRAAHDRAANHLMQGHHFDRTPLDAPTGPYSGWEHTIYREKKTALNSLPELQVVQLEEVLLPGEKKGTEQANSAEVWFSARVPGFTPPSFQCFAISRVYRIKAKIGVQIGEKKFEHEVESHVGSLGSVG